MNNNFVNRPMEWTAISQWYLNLVRAALNDQQYFAFLDVWHAMEQRLISEFDVIERITSLFRNHPLLLLYFNIFLPDGFRCYHEGGRICIVYPVQYYDHEDEDMEDDDDEEEEDEDEDEEESEDEGMEYEGDSDGSEDDGRSLPGIDDSDFEEL